MREIVPGGWVSEEQPADVGAQWAAHAARFGETGRWPLVLSSLRGDDERPWLAGELDPSASGSPDDADVEAVLRQGWAESIEEDEDEDDAEFGSEDLAPFGRSFPGLAPALSGPSDDGAPRRVAASLEGRLGLVAVRRPADCPAVLGWMGPVNHYEDMGGLAAVLRSWEERFGVVLVGLGFDTLTAAVRRPPTTHEHALQVAAEHLALCPDNVWQGPGSLSEYAASLVGTHQWDFWWD